MENDHECDSSTEARLFAAARHVFHEEGYKGARMQTIADRAGMNKSMLHYYYRSKERLFEAVFREAVERVVPRITEAARVEQPLEGKIRHLVHTYIDQLAANPYLPGFLVFEMQRDPERLKELFLEKVAPIFRHLASDMEQAAARGEIRPIEPLHLLANIVSLCVFPFVARPIVQAIGGMNRQELSDFWAQRKDQVTDFILRAIRP